MKPSSGLRIYGLWFRVKHEQEDAQLIEESSTTMQFKPSWPDQATYDLTMHPATMIFLEIEHDIVEKRV